VHADKLLTCQLTLVRHIHNVLSMLRCFAVVMSGFILASGAAVAASPVPSRKTALPQEPMQIRIVRSAQPGCEPDCPEWIAAQGRIDAGALRQFKGVMRRLGARKAPVFIHSFGGSVRDAIAIGRLLRGKGLDVAVVQTLFIPCVQADEACRKREGKGTFQGLPQMFSVCASACTFVLAAGVQRFAGPWARVGVHQMKSFKTYAKLWRTYRVTAHPDGSVSRTLVSEKKISETTVETQTTRSNYNEIRRYFTEMGIGKEVMPLIEATPPASMHWLTRDELRLTALATDGAGEQFPPGFRASGSASGSTQNGNAPQPPAVKCNPLAREGFGCASGAPRGTALRNPR
jgi:hypothetical protein